MVITRNNFVILDVIILAFTMVAGNPLPTPTDPKDNLFSQLIDEDVIQFKISSKSFKDVERNEGDRYRMMSYPSDTLLTDLDDSHQVPVYVSLLEQDDRDFDNQPANGIPTNHPLAVFMTRHPDYRELTFVLAIENINGTTSSSIFTFTKSQDTQGSVGIPVVSRIGQRRLGIFTLDYTIIKQTKNQKLLSGSGAQEFKNRSSHRVVHSGHRGLGVGVRTDILGYEVVSENTITSYNLAGGSGADMVELDVSLTNDNVVVVYHDLQLRAQSTGEVVNIRDLTYDQLMSHEYQPLEETLKSKNVDNPDLALFPKLRTVLERVKSQTAINIEVKYPYPLENGTWSPCQPVDLDFYLETILDEVVGFAVDREIMFSSFDPDVCTSLKLKQSRYPVFLLTKDGVYSPPNGDLRMSNVDMGILYASACKLEGINAYGEYVLNLGQKFVADLHKRLQLILYVWEGQLTPTQLNTLIDIDTDGFCYDKIDLKRSHVKDSDRHFMKIPISANRSRAIGIAEE